MYRPRCFFVVVLAFGLGFVALPPAQAAKRARKADAQRPAVRLGVVGSMFRETPEALMLILMKPFQTLMEEQTGVRGTVVNGADYDALGRHIMEETIQVGVFNGFEFAWAKQKYPDLQALIVAVNEGPHVRAHLVARNDFRGATLADLKGERLTLPRLSPEHVQLYLERRCTPAGVAPAKFYSTVIRTQDTEEALDLVIDGKAAAAVVDDTALECFRTNKPGRAARLRNLHSSESFPSAVLAYKPGTLPRDLVNRFRAGMIGASNSPRGQEMLRMYRLSGFAAVPEGFENSLAEIARAYPPSATR